MRIRKIIGIGTLIGITGCGFLEPENMRPIARIRGLPYTIEYNRAIYVGNSVLLDGSDSNDPNGRIVSYSWDFGDGEFGTGEKVRHAYGVVGNFTARLLVEDDDKARDNDSIRVDVLPK
jgi:hypothetical protein